MIEAKSLRLGNLIELTREDGDSILVNIDYIVAIEKSWDRLTYVVMRGHQNLKVRERPEIIKGKIENLHLLAIKGQH